VGGRWRDRGRGKKECVSVRGGKRKKERGDGK
jgi:hypothetical protein